LAKVPDSSHILVQGYGYSNAIQQDYMGEILGLQPPLEIKDNAQKSSEQLASVADASGERLKENDLHGDNTEGDGYI